MKRERHALTAPELAELEHVSRLAVDERPAAARALWHAAATLRGLDPASVIGEGGIFTALPLGHGRHWCWPASLKCAKAPMTI